MKLKKVFKGVATLVAVGIVFTSAAQPLNSIRNTNALSSHVANHSKANQSLPDGIIEWDALTKTVQATNGQDFARFIFAFTNVTSGVVTILNVHPSCGCTTAELPPVPWRIASGSAGLIKLSVNLLGKSGALFKTVKITTDQGSTNLILRVFIQRQAMPEMGADRRAAGVAAAKLDRQAVFKGDCATCHSSGLQNKYGQQLFAAACGICHEAKERASMVPDLHHLTDAVGKPVSTDEEFWRSWITSGKAGTLMPAFAKSQGGPLTDLQIASLAAYLNTINPARMAQANAK